MKWTSATALLVALSAAGAGATYVVTRRPMGPTEIIKNVRAEMGTVTFEQRSALSQLGLALRAAEDRRDELLVAEVLQTRAEVYLELGDSENGLLDLKRISAIRPRDYDLRLQIARLTAESGDVDLAFILNAIAFNALWPKTAIATAAVQNMLGGDEAVAKSRNAVARGPSNDEPCIRASTWSTASFAKSTKRPASTLTM